jgi:MFS-type transporter involved in bile tolerance (Atg22 family)
LAPFTIGLVTQLSNNQRIGFAVIFVFLIVGLALMTFVKEERAEELD